MAKQSNKDTFLKWAISVLPAQRSEWIEENILKMEQFAIATKLISGSIFDISDVTILETIYRAVEKNKIFQIKNKRLIKNIENDFKTYMQYCSQTLEGTKQASKLEPSMFEPLLESVSAVATSTESKTTPKNILVSTSTSATCETEFYDYLQNRTKLADRTCISYVSAIRSAERYAVDNGYISCSLLNEDKETIVATATELYGDSNFIKLNEQQHNRFSAAINKLLEFIGAKVPEKAVVSTG